MTRAAVAVALDRFLLRVGPVLKATGGHYDAADSAVPTWARNFETAVERMRAGIDMRAFEHAVASCDLQAALDAIPWDEMSRGLRETWRPAIERMMQTGAEQARRDMQSAPGSPGMAIRFDIANPRAVEWATQHAADLVVQVSDETKSAVRGTILGAFDDGLHPTQSARIIRDQVGLLERHARAVDNYRSRLQAEGKSASEVDRKAQRYASKLLRYRAENIARTETLTAHNQGQLELWKQARDNGYLSQSSKRIWIVTEDDRLCPECAALDGAKASIDGEFDGGVSSPPLHPSCRCAQSLEAA